ncbi:MAG: hypothetical protein A2Y86_03640 [Candidatus Aminicenantes bacterium RBG_13_62_12]|nr:MAG: hypothetical protein A2Y86_03640 [Candidatus Aminicenantes bacterium RBG_13_62_12]
MAMRKTMGALLAIVLGGLLITPLGAEFGPEAVLGTWLVAARDGHVTIYRCGEKYCGRITWSTTPEDLDAKNPDPAKRSNKILGMNIMWGFVYDDGKWVAGRVYDPDSGKTYKGRMWLESADVLRLKGFVGIILLGRTETWTRVK